DLAGEQHEALAALDAIGQAGQRLFRMPREKQVARVRIHIERVGTQSKKLFVHRLTLNLYVLVIFWRGGITSAPETAPRCAIAIAIGSRVAVAILTQPRHG